MKMGVEKVHACPNYCILFCDDTFKDLTNALDVVSVGIRTMTTTLGTKPLVIPPPRGKRVRKSRYIHDPQPQDNTSLGNDSKQRKISALVMLYMSIVDQLKLHPKEAVLKT